MLLYLHVWKSEVFTPIITVCLLWQLCKAQKAREEDNDSQIQPLETID